jgi:hypothetical protein
VAEQGTHKPLVGGSNPPATTKEINKISEKFQPISLLDIIGQERGKVRISFNELLLLLLLPVALLFTNTSICYANAPPPPSIFIIVPHAPKDLILSIGSVEANRKDKAFESYYGFFFDVNRPIDDNLQITTGNSTYQIKLPPLNSYSSTFTLDLGNKKLTPGTPSFRPYEFASITIILTLLIEGIIFYLYGYRKKSSWITFLVTNLITQGFLYIWLNKTVYPSFHSYVTLDLIFGEFGVLIIEIIVFLIFVRERPRLMTFSYVILANLASLIAGGFLINALI